MNHQIIHIVPQLPPVNSGVADYATLVGRRMEAVGAGVVCGYVAAGQNASELPADGPRIRNVTGQCNPRALWRAVEQLASGSDQFSAAPSPQPQAPRAAVVLHYSGYGYDRNGAPAWLVAALGRRPAGLPVVTFFHELYAKGRPWQRAFWYSAQQQRITAEVARLSDAILTNREQSARWLEEQTGRPAGSVTSLPVPSNVGEPAQLPEFNSRPPRAVTFGGERRKRFALYDDADKVAPLLRRWSISELIDIGPKCPIDRRPFDRLGISVTALGYLSAPEVSRALSECRTGFVDYPFDRVAKSGVFAAYVAHGVVPIVRATRDNLADDIAVGREALALHPAKKLGSWLDRLPQISEAARRWYGANSSVCHARAILQIAFGSVGRNRLAANALLQ